MLQEVEFLISTKLVEKDMKVKLPSKSLTQVKESLLQIG